MKTMNFKIDDILNKTIDGMSQESITNIISKVIDESVIDPNSIEVDFNNKDLRSSIKTEVCV